MLYTDRFHVRW